MTTAQETGDKIAKAYGLLWLMSIDTRTKNGLLAHRARMELLDLLAKDDQARGITAARLSLGDRDPGMPSRDELMGRKDF